MPWSASDATRHTKEADTPHKQSVWARVANAALKSGDSEGSAIRQANAAVARMKKQTAMSGMSG